MGVKHFLRRWARIFRAARRSEAREARMPNESSGGRWSRLLRRDARPEVDEELAFHLEQRVRDYIARGMDPEAARAAALERLSDLEGARRECTELLSSERRAEARRARLGVSWLDFKLGFRMLVKYPGLTVVGGLAIAFAVAVGAAAFELTTQVLYPTLPLPEGDRIVGIRLWDTRASEPEEQVLRDLASWQEELESVEDLGAFHTIERNLITGDEGGPPVEVEVAAISASAFRVARVPPLLGRALVAGGERPGAPAVVVVGYDVWQTRFAGDPDIVGREIRLGSEVHTVVGVMPAGFAFPVNHGLWVPLRLNPLDYGRREGPGIVIFGHLASGVTLAEAQTELTALGRRAAAEFPDTHEHLRPEVMEYPALFLDPTNPEARAGAFFSNAFIVMFLILVCANVATLVFARTTTRESEMVIRNALGASRARIVAQLFAETLVLGGVAAAVGLAAAAFGLRWGLGVLETVDAGGEGLPFWFDPSLSPGTAVYAGLLATLVAVVAGVLPGLKITGRGVQARRGQAVSGGSSLRFGKAWTAVIVTQVAFTVAFLPLLAAMAVDTVQIDAPDFGFAAEEYLSVRVEMDRTTAPGVSAEAAEAEFLSRFRASYGELERRLKAEAGVIGVTFASQLPGGYHSRRLIEAEGVPTPPGQVQERQVQPASVDVGFFDALNAPILSGRGFHPGDLAPDARVVIVNRSFVEQFLGGRNPIGRRVRYLCSGAGCDTPDPEPGPWYEIVGIVSELSMTIDSDLPHNAGLYHPVLPGQAQAVLMAVHVRGDPAALAPRLRALAFDVDPTLRLSSIRPLDEIRWGLLMTYLFWLKVGLAAGCIVLVLSTVGIYSIMSFTVSRRTREIGIRVALGAGRRAIASAVLARAMAQLGLGLLAGAGLMVVLLVLDDGSLSLYGAALIAGGAAIMMASGVLAAIAPTRRALRIEPTEALRADG